MHYAGPLDLLPIWGVFLATVAVVLLAVEGGFRLGQYRRRRSEQEDRPPVGEMVAATLALLAFMLAFTFGLAASRFDVRRGLVIDEANAIGTTYLRAGLLPEPHRSDVRSLLREYVDVRLEAVQPGKLSRSIDRSEELHARLWAHAVAVGEKNPGSIVVGLFIASLNEVIDLHAKRLALGVREPHTWNHLGGAVFRGNHRHIRDGIPCRTGWFRQVTGASALVLAFSAVVTLIADLDRPQEGLLRVSQQTMIDLQKTLAAPSR